MDIAIILFIVCVVLIAVIAIAGQAQKGMAESEEKKLRERLSATEGFSPSEFTAMNYGLRHFNECPADLKSKWAVNQGILKGIGVDKERRLLAIFDHGKIELVPVKDLLEVDVIFDDETVTSSKRGNQLGGAIVGGLVAGGAGAIIGGLSGDTVSRRNLTKVSLKLIIKRTEEHSFVLDFLGGKSASCMGGISSSSSWAAEMAGHWHDLLKVLMQQEIDQKIPDQNGVISIEIQRLARLVESGDLTPEEFAMAKAKLLS